jgi:predicted transcriptional regulator
MPATTTLKLPETLKKRISPLAQSAGKTAHAWMVEAIESQAALAEKRKAFVNDALAAEKAVAQNRKVYTLDQARNHISALARGRKPRRPTPVKW